MSWPWPIFLQTSRFSVPVDSTTPMPCTVLVAPYFNFGVVPFDKRGSLDQFNYCRVSGRDGKNLYTIFSNQPESASSLPCLRKEQRKAGSNEIGMLAWRLLLRTPEPLGDQRGGWLGRLERLLGFSGAKHNVGREECSLRRLLAWIY